MKRLLFLILFSALVFGVAAGCANVKPWDREYLADPIMRLDYEREEQTVRDHFLSTREGAAGGFGVSGGGCGCN